jgi:hypothetical protein
MKKTLVIVMIAIAVILSLTSCAVSGGVNAVPIKVNPDGIGYELFYIEGMPCMRIARMMNDQVWSYDGVTCDWSKWAGSEE